MAALQFDIWEMMRQASDSLPSWDIRRRRPGMPVLITMVTGDGYSYTLAKNSVVCLLSMSLLGADSLEGGENETPGGPGRICQHDCQLLCSRGFD